MRCGVHRLTATIERAGVKDRPYGWIVTVTGDPEPGRGGGSLSCRPVMGWDEALDVVLHELERMVRAGIA